MTDNDAKCGASMYSVKDGIRFVMVIYLYVK